jgi:hypothetical protein
MEPVMMHAWDLDPGEAERLQRRVAMLHPDNKMFVPEFELVPMYKASRNGLWFFPLRYWRSISCCFI